MRLTYRSMMGDYGCAQDFKNEYAERCAIRNKLGKFEDAYEWNPINECGLPTEDGEYYVTVRDSLGAMIDTVLRDEFSNGKFSLENVDYKVLAWARILVPEIYKEGE